MKSYFYHFVISVILIIGISSCTNQKKEVKALPEINTDTVAAETINHFLFVSKWYGKTGVYKYDLETKQQETVWWHPRENVYLLVSRNEPKPVFFLTVRKTGFKANFPFFQKVKVYRISSDISSTEFIYEIKDGMQITARWNDDNNLEIVFTAIDKTDPSYVNKHIKTFDSYGKLINDEIEIYNIVTDGFPELLPKRNPTVSPSGRYGISVLGDSLFLKTIQSDSLILITAISHNLNKIRWSDDEEYIFISTLDLANETIKSRNPETSELFVYSIMKDTLVASWSGAGVKNFFTIDSLIVFDDGFNRNTTINIYNYISNDSVDNIQMKGECGLFYIPEL